MPKKLLAILREKRNKVFLVIAHIHLEGDALGSQLALASLLRRLGKKVVVVNEDSAPPEYSFLPGVERIIHGLPCLAYDVAVVIDCSDLSRIGRVAKLIRPDRPLVNIDHHISNTGFGDINWVKPDASSASEMVFELFKALGVRINKKEALLLYTGILADTGSFKYATTSSFTHRVAGELLEHGLDAYGIYRHIHESLDFDTVKSLGRIIQTLKVTKNRRVAWLEVRYSMIRRNPNLAEMTDGIIHFARCIKGVDVALLFKEIRLNREIRVNLRSRGCVDVNALAGVFGGGGHRMASGCTLRGHFKEAVSRVVAETERRLA